MQKRHTVSGMDAVLSVRGLNFIDHYNIENGGIRMERIYLVEDEEKLRTELCALLEKNGYQCIAPEQFNTVEENIINEHPDLVILDLNLPVHDGFYICREVRRQLEVPIIVVTSSSSEMDELMSLNLGADDFITKPYNTHILLAHIGAVLKRAYGRKPSCVITHKGLTLDVLKSKAYYKDKSMELTKNEMGILKMLMENKDKIVSRNELICQLWDMEEFIEDSTLTVNVNRLRAKLSELGLSDYLTTKRGQGYIV